MPINSSGCLEMLFSGEDGVSCGVALVFAHGAEEMREGFT